MIELHGYWLPSVWTRILPKTQALRLPQIVDGLAINNRFRLSAWQGRIDGILTNKSWVALKSFVSINQWVSLVLSRCLRQSFFLGLWIPHASATIGTSLVPYEKKRCQMTQSEPWISLEGISQHLGVSQDTIHRWIRNRNLPAHQIGRLWKFKVSEVDGWVRGGGQNDTDAHGEEKKSSVS